MRWALPFAMLGAVGCSKVQLPHLGKGVSIQMPGSKTSASTNGSKAGSKFEQGCQQLPGIEKVAMFSIEQYPPLITFIKSVSPLIRGDEKRLLNAHAVALKETNQSVVNMLMGAKRPIDADIFKKRVVRMLKPRPSLTTDLSVMLRVLTIEDRSPCASAYLNHFYSNFVTALDPMGEAVFGLTQTPAPEDTLLKEVPLPDDLKNAPPAELSEGVLRIALPRLQASAALDAALNALETRQKDASSAVILFDLRSVGGSDIKILERLQASAAHGWGAMPIVFWTDRSTRGTAALIVQLMSEQPNVLVIGAHEETYGFGRKLVQQSTELVKDLSPLTLTIGSELMQPTGFPVRADGYQFRLRRDGKENRDSSRDPGVNDGLFVTLKEALERAGKWHGEARPGTAAVPLTDPGTVAPATEIVPAEGGGVAPPAQSEDPSGIFGSDASTQQSAPPPSSEPPADVPLADGAPTTF